ncbi:MAG: hypothetical protein KC457_25680, partial [Myxococcales bacterium]|nr:hypothetical protein [Myxococcales bacterium]
GTSMWMQILVGAGLEAIGEPFPGDWRALLTDANPDGFWESQLLGGIYYRTNPHPISGAFLFPEQTVFHAVKVMIPGLIRSDIAYLDRVVATVREWRQFCASRERLRELTRERLGLEPHDELFRQQLPPALEWWSDNFSLLRDIATRRYAAHVCSYQSLLEDPEQAIAEVLRWLGRGDLQKAIAAVRPERQTQHQGAKKDGPDAGVGDLEPEFAEVFDELYDHIHRAKPLSAAFLVALNDTDARLRPRRLLAHETQARIAAARSMLSGVAEAEEAPEEPPAG